MRVRSLEQVTADGDLPWFRPALDRMHARANHADPVVAGFLRTDRPIAIARAPGRLDVMGGIADYSGSLVLEMPLAVATFAMAQEQDPLRLDVLSIRDGQPFHFSIDVADVTESSAEVLRSKLAERPDDRWAAYVVGSVHACLTSSEAPKVRRGIRLLLASDVPEGKGVSSSAALEVATMTATAACYGMRLDGAAIATACQWAENHIAGAPCGIMDQMTSALGQRDRLLRLRCQPASVEGHVAIPAGYRFYGIDSGVRHVVSGADYGTVRTAAFMGYRMIADLAGLPVRVEAGRARVHDDRWGGYLANLSPQDFDRDFADRLPRQMRGEEFVAQYGTITDAVTRVEPGRVYPVRQATAHPVFENARVTRFGELLATGLTDDAAAREMGDAMRGSHASYSECGLGSDATDRLVGLVMEAGVHDGLFGAKITGGGSGGTVAVFGNATARSAVHHIARQYAAQTGVRPYVFDGSGPGADTLGVLRLAL